MLNSKPLNQNKRIENSNWIFFLAIGICIFWFILSFFNRLMQDDLPMLLAVKDHGVIGATQLIYDKWNTRWMAILWVDCWYSGWSFTSHPFIYHLTTFVFMIGCFGMFFQSLKSRNYFPELNIVKTIPWSVMSFGALLAATYHIGDTWLWVVTSGMYGWNLGFFILAISVIIKEKQNKIDYLLIAFCGIYIGGAGEIFATALLIFGAVLSFTGYRKTINSNKLILLFFAMLVVSFYIAISGSGHSARSNLLPVTSFVQAFKIGVYDGMKIIFYKSPIRLILVALLLMPFYFIGKIYKKQECISVKEYLIKYKIPCLVLWSCWVMLHSMMITKIMGDYGPGRAWSSISLMSVLMIGYLWWVAGKNTIIKNGKLLYCCGIFATVFIFFSCTFQFFKMKKYAAALDQRMEILLDAKAKNTSDTLFLEPLPSAGFLHDANIDATSQGAWLGLKNTIVIKNENDFK